MATIDNIIKVNVSTATKLADSTAYGHMLIVCPPPLSPGDSTTYDVSAYSTLDELEACGFSEADMVYGAMKLILSQNHIPDQVYIAVQKKISGQSENIQTTMQRALEYTSDWWCIIPVGISNEDLQLISEWVELSDANKFMLGATTEVSTSPVSGNHSRTAFVHETQVTDYYNAALAAECLSYAPGSETWQFKSVNDIAGQNVTKAEISAMDEACIGYYLNVYNRGCSFGGKTLSGEWIDVIRFRDWLVDRVQRNVYELFTTVPKVPYTDDGIAMVQSCIKKAFDEGLEAGGIATDSQDEDGTILPGYTITVPKAIEITSAMRQNRSLPGIKATARLAGAIHNTTLSIELTY